MGAHFNTPNGENVRGHLHSADASGGVVMVLYTYEGAVRTLLSSERLVVSDYILVTVAGGDSGIIFDDEANIGATAPQFVLVRGTFVANGGAAMNLNIPFMAPRGVMPFVYAPAGVVDVSINAIIIQT